MLKKLALLAVAAAFVTACGSAAADNRTAQPETATGLHVSRIKDYKSIAELKAASTAVVRATVASSTVEKLNDLPITISTVEVRKTLWGQVPSETLAILQVGDESMVPHDTGAILSKGREYLLFVTPYHLTPNDNTGRYVITGDQGNFVLDSKGDSFAFAGAGNPPGLPRSLRKEEIDSGAFLN
jgi:hypothetical protein